MHGAQVYAVDAPAPFGQHYLHEAAAGSNQRVPRVTLYAHAADEGGRLVLARGPELKPRLFREALDYRRARGLLQDDEVWLALAYDGGEPGLAARAAVLYVVAEKLQTHSPPTFPIRVR
jgi:hypothetical protein